MIIHLRLCSKQITAEQKAGIEIIVSKIIHRWFHKKSPCHKYNFNVTVQYLHSYEPKCLAGQWLLNSYISTHI